MLVDDVILKIVAGDGGNGGRSFHTNYGSVKVRADGGNGGRGGDIYFTGNANTSDLSQFRYKKQITASNGGRGSESQSNGKSGDDITILVPLGTTIIDTETQETVEVLEEGKPIIGAKGGRGRAGNVHSQAETKGSIVKNGKEQKGQKRELHLILNIIADIGLIGLPNAGKSSLLAVLTRANPKIGNYPFTTLEPNIGTLQGEKIVLADIPGLVEGASKGKGLGIQFLKHIKKTKMLLHCIDASAPNPYEIYKTVRSEFKDYDPTLLEKKEIILLTKSDLVNPEVIKKQKKELKKTKKEILATSIYDEKSIFSFRDFLLS
jgi:GTPase